jgi:hypothetical protein
MIRAAAAFFSLLILAGCATTARISAAGDVHSLLVAIRDDDRVTFDAHIDRRALEAEIQATLVDQAKAANLGDAGAGLGLLLSGPLSRAAGGALLRPDVFRAIADYYGYRPDTPIPGQLTLAAVLSPLPDGRVCARNHKGGSCLLTFANEGGTWRLVAVDVDYLRRAGSHRRS